jgi:RecA/RadA recombinase
MAVSDMKKKLTELSKAYKSLSKAEFTRSGSVVLDAILGGGIPRGVFILWSAENGCGKSTGALHISRAFCMQGKKVLYLDYEGGVNTSQIEGIGLSDYLYSPEENPDGNFILYQVQTYKDAESIFDQIMEDVDLVIIDSATAMLTEKVKGSSSEDSLPGLDSRVMSTFLKKYKAEAVRSGVSWIIINQIRTKIATGYGQHTHDEEAGGNALKFYPDVRLQMKKAYKGTLTRVEETASGDQEVPFGSICSIYAVKNRYERSNIPLSIAIIFGKGISNEFAYYDFLMGAGAIEKKGGWYNISVNGEEAKVQGVNRVVEWIYQHKSLVRDYINEHGGYRLLMKEDSKVDLGVDVEPEEDVYASDSTVEDSFEVDGDEE